MNNLQQKVSNPTKKAQSPNPPKQGKGQISSPAPTFAAIAANKPTCASLVLCLEKEAFPLAGRPTPVYLTEIFNKALKASLHHQVHIAATKWTANGNVIVTGGHMATAQQLQNASAIISQALAEDQTVDPDDPLPPFPIRPNVKWSKILINGIPTGVTQDQSEAYSSEECHDALAQENPSYSSLLVTQKPSWVRPPSSYTAGISSSTVVAFEDPDGCKARALLAERHLYAFGVRVSAKRWKQRPHKSKPKPNPEPMDADTQEVRNTLPISTPPPWHMRPTTGSDSDFDAPPQMGNPFLAVNIVQPSPLVNRTATATPVSRPDQTQPPTRKSARNIRPSRPYDA